MNEIGKGARQTTDLIGRAFGGDGNAFFENMERAKQLTVLPRSEPSEDEKAQFEAMLQNKTIELGEYGVMIRVDRNISMGLNLKSGYYAFGQCRLEGGILYLARQLGGWEDSTVENPPKEK